MSIQTLRIRYVEPRSGARRESQEVTINAYGAQLADTRRELFSCRSIYRALLEAASFKDLLK